MNAQHRRLLLLSLVLTAYAWRVIGLDWQSLWRDEVDAIYFAVRNLNETLAMFAQAAQNGPLYFLALRPWFAVLGTSEFVLRYPSAMAGVASVPLLWQVTRRLLPDRTPGLLPTAAIAAILLTFNPYQIWYGQEGKMYATITFLALLATWFWLRGLEGGGWRYWAAYLVTVSMAMYMHLLMVLLIPVHLAWFLLAWPLNRAHWRGYGLALLGLTLPYLPMVWWHWWLLTSPDKLSGFTFTPFDKMVQSLALDHARGFLNTMDTLWLAPIFFLAGAGVLLGSTEIDAQRPAGPALAPWRRLGIVLLWLVLPVLLIFLISLRQPVFTERYVIWIGPAAVLLLALGIKVLGQASGRFGVLITAGVMIYTIALWSYVGVQQKVLTIKYDLRSAVHYIQAHRQPADLLVLQIPHQEWSYRYYSSDLGPNPFAGSDDRMGHWVGGPYTNYGEPDDQARAAVDTQMRTATAGSRDVWVMLSEAEMWDARRLMDEWLNGHGALIEQIDYPGAQVRHYQLKGDQ